MGFFDGGGKAAKFQNPGDTVTGTITRPYREVQATEFGTNRPATWPSGDPKMQAVIDIDTALREDANDDGARTLYVQSSRMRKAIQGALRTAGASDLAVGGKLTITFVGYGDGQNPANPPKEFTAVYSPPAGMLTPDPEPAREPAMAAAAPTPAPAPAAASGGGQSPVDQVKALLPTGMSDEEIANAVGIGAEAVAAIRTL